jgi:hypothetical protein
LSRHLTLVWLLRDIGPRQTELAAAWALSDPDPARSSGRVGPVQELAMSGAVQFRFSLCEEAEIEASFARRAA